MKQELQKKIEFLPAWDKRNPDPKKNYGIHGVDIKFLLIGTDGAIQFVIFTNWHLPHVQKETDTRPIEKAIPHYLHKPMPADLGYHSRKPQYKGQASMSFNCDILGGKCYYDGSGLAAEELFKEMLSGGHNAVWKRLEEEYEHRFNKKGELK